MLDPKLDMLLYIYTYTRIVPYFKLVLLWISYSTRTTYIYIIHGNIYIKYKTTNILISTCTPYLNDIVCVFRSISIFSYFSDYINRKKTCDPLLLAGNWLVNLLSSFIIMHQSLKHVYDINNTHIVV